MTLEGVRAFLHTNIGVCYTALIAISAVCVCQVELLTGVGPE